MSNKVKAINATIFHLTQLSSIILSFVWFGWKGLVVAFLINWSINTEKYS